MRVLNLYAGAGGNRASWDNVQVTAVEHDPEVASVYNSRFPADEIIITDAHAYLLEHYSEFDFIWSSPPCTTHSRIREAGSKAGRYKVLYPDMTLWQEIVFLQHFASGKWVVENVQPYYEPLIQPSCSIGRHLFWSNFRIPQKGFSEREIVHMDVSAGKVIYGLSLADLRMDTQKKRAVLRNQVDPEVGRYILNCARETMQEYLVGDLFSTPEESSR